MSRPNPDREKWGIKTIRETLVEISHLYPDAIVRDAAGETTAEDILFAFMSVWAVPNSFSERFLEQPCCWASDGIYILDESGNKSDKPWLKLVN